MFSCVLHLDVTDRIVKYGLYAGPPIAIPIIHITVILRVIHYAELFSLVASISEEKEEKETQDQFVFCDCCHCGNQLFQSSHRRGQ